MVFGRCFETALGAYFRGEDPSAVLFKEWGAFRDTPFEYKKGDSWDRLAHQGVHLLQKFAQDDRVRIHRPQDNLQVKMLRTLTGNNDFVAYIEMCIRDSHYTWTASFAKQISRLRRPQRRSLLLPWEKSMKNRVPVFTFIREIITRLGRRQEDTPQHCIDALIRARLDRKVRRTTTSKRQLANTSGLS